MIREQEANIRREGRLRFAGVLSYVVAAAIALLVTYAFDLRIGLRDRGGAIALGGAQYAAAVGHALALLAPVAIVVGLALAAIEFIAPSPFGRLRRLFSLRTMFRPDPETLGSVSAHALGFGFATVGVFRVTTKALEVFHAQIVIAAAVAVAAPMLVIVGLALARRLEPLLVRFCEGLDEVGSPALLLVTVALGILASCFRLSETSPEVDRAISWSLVRIGAVFVSVVLVAASTISSSPSDGRAIRRIGALLVASIAVGTTTSVFTYGRTTSQRGFVEEIAWSSGLAYRLWSEALDRDGDGYPALLGGRDCNDRRAGVNPRALDPRGDGIDSDCFGGDGTPEFEDRRINPPSAPILAGETPPNILLISIDTMRPDRLGVLGNRRGITPRLDAFARDAVVFDQVEASSPRTTRSVPALFTGQHPGRLPFERSLNHLDLDPSVETLAERLNGPYETAAILGTSYFQTAPNLLQGFASVQQATSMKSSPRFATDLAVQWLTSGRSTARPFLLWVHYFAPHEPYLNDGTPSRFGNRPEDYYDTEVQRADAEVGRILDHLRIHGLDRNTVVIVFSDHGESLGDHGAWGHSTRLTEDQLRAVMMIRAPGIAGRVERTPIALFDLHPTVLDLAGVRPTVPESARTLVPLLRGMMSGFRNRPLFAEILPDAVYAIETQSVRRGDDKLIFFPRTGRFSLYDLRSDPNESRDLADARPALARELRELILAWDVASHRPDNRISQQIHDAHVRELPPDATRLDARFANGITLVGARIRGARAAKTGNVVADLYFRAERPITTEYFIHFTYEPADALRPGTGTPLEAHHTALDGSFPTTLWRPGEILRDTVVLKIPPGARTDTHYVGQVELWSHFHVRMPVAVEIAGHNVESVRFGRVEFY